MKIAVSAERQAVDSPLSSRLGRRLFFVIYDSTEDSVQIIPNTYVGQIPGAGINAAQRMLNFSVRVALTSNLGSNVFKILTEKEIKVFKTNSGNSAHAISQYQHNELDPIISATPEQASCFSLAVTKSNLDHWRSCYENTVKGEGLDDSRIFAERRLIS